MLLFQWCQMDKCTECTFNSWLLGISGEKISYKYKLRKTGSGQHSILKKPEVTIFHIADVQFWQVYGAGRGIPTSPQRIPPSSRGIPPSPQGRFPAERGVHPWFLQCIADHWPIPTYIFSCYCGGWYSHLTHTQSEHKYTKMRNSNQNKSMVSLKYILYMYI